MTYVNVQRIALTLCLILSASATRAELFHFGFEPGQTPAGFTGPLGGMLHPGTDDNTPPTLSTEKALSGTTSLKSYVHIYNSQSPWRSMAMINKGQYKFDFNNGASTKDYWIGFAIWIPAVYPERNPLGWPDMLFEFHTSPKDGDPWGACSQNNPINIWGIPDSPTTGKFRLTLRGGADFSDCVNSGTVQKVVFDEPIGSYKNGEWNSIVINIRFDYQVGFAKVWVNGALGADYKDKPLYHSNTGNPYPLWGFYGGWKERITNDPNIVTRTFYYDDIRISTGPGSSYDSVAPIIPPRNQLSAPTDLHLQE